MQCICRRWGGGGGGGGESVAAAAAKAKTRSPEQKLCRRSDLAHGAGAGAALHRCTARKARERQRNLTDLVGDVRFFSIISSKVGMATWRFNNIFVFKLWRLDYPLSNHLIKCRLLLLLLRFTEKLMMIRRDLSLPLFHAPLFPPPPPFTNKE